MKVHVITAAAAFAAGLTAGLTGAGSPEVSAASLTRNVAVSSLIKSSNAAMQSIRTKVEAAHCAKAEANAGLSAGECSVEKGARTTISWGDGTADDVDTVATVFRFSGTWAKQAQ